MTDPTAAAKARSDPDEEHPVIAALATDMSLAQGAMHGAKWLGPARLVAQMCQFLGTAVTARILLPEEFGEAAIALAIASFAQLFTDLGLSAAVVHARVATRSLLSTAFWLNFVTGVALTIGISAAAVPVAHLYHQPGLVPLLIVASLNFTFSCGVVQTALLERALNFKQIALYETSAMILGTLATPILALAGVGTMSLVLGYLVTTITVNMLLWIRVPWRPDVRPTRSTGRRLWRFSRGLVGFNATNYWARNLDTLLIGKYASLGELGQYTRAFNLTMVPVQQMNLVLARLLFPTLTRIRDDPQRMGRAWVRGTRTTATFVLPLTVTLAAAAPSVVAVLYGPRWKGMEVLLELLALATVPQVIAASSGSLFRATGHTGLLFRVGLFSSGFSVAAIVVGLNWGAQGVAASLLVKSYISLLVILVPLSRVVKLRYREVTLPFLTVAVPSIALALGELAVRFTVGDSLSPFIVLPLQLITGGTLMIWAGWRWGDRAAKQAIVKRYRSVLRRIRLRATA